MDETKLLMLRLAVIRRIVEVASDPGKTTVQKIVYFLQNGVGAPLGYRFKMHYFGPYSEQLDSNLSLADAMGIVEVDPDAGGYGFHISTGDYGVENPDTPMPWDKIDKTIKMLDGLDLWKLELLATTHFVESLHPQSSKGEIVDMVHRLKPKFSEDIIKDVYSNIRNIGSIQADSPETTA